MKKIYALALSLCSIGAISAQNDAKSLYETGKEAEDRFNKALPAAIVTQQMSPEEAYSLIEAYNIYMQVLPLDSLPNEKGKIKPKYSKKIINSLTSHVKDFDFQRAAIFLYNSDKRYPEAYTAFKLTGELPRTAMFAEVGKAIHDTICAENLFNAGLCAYGARAYKESAEAFQKAAQLDPRKIDAYVYEIASYQNSDMDASQKEALIYVAAENGYKAHGATNTYIFNNYINKFLNNNDIATANRILMEEAQKDPTNGNIELLLGILKNKEEKYDEALVHFTKAGELSTTYNTLLDASRQINLIAKHKNNAIDPNAADAAEQKAAVKRCFETALAIANKAKGCEGADNQVNSIIDDIQYSIDNYFN